MNNESSVRLKISKNDAAKIIAGCRRICAICAALNSDFTAKFGQIAHLDRDRRNRKLDNLAYLCLAHHDEYDTIRKQTRRFASKEVQIYREALLEGLANGSILPGNSQSASVRLRLHGASICRLTHVNGYISAYIELQFTAANTGSTPTCIEDVTLKWGETFLAADSSGLKTYPEIDKPIFRRDAEYLTCTRSQSIAPGEVLGLQGDFRVDLAWLEKNFPKPGSLWSMGKAVRLDPAFYLELKPVIGPPAALLFTEARLVEPCEVDPEQEARFSLEMDDWEDR